MNGNGHIEHQEADLFTAPPIVPSQSVDYGHLIKTLSAWRYVLNARLLALLTLGGAMIGFAFTMYDPTPLRLWGEALYAILCLWPTMWLYLKKG